MFMKVFIAGPRALRTLDEKIIRQLISISAKEHEVIVGDADGIDTAVQQFFADRQYENVIIYATEGKARNNVGRWKSNRLFHLAKQKVSDTMQRKIWKWQKMLTSVL